MRTSKQKFRVSSKRNFQSEIACTMCMYSILLVCSLYIADNNNSNNYSNVADDGMIWQSD